MNYIYINKADENWIVDRFIQEWCSYNSDYVTDNIEDADIVWIIAPWNLSSISTKILKEKKIICTIHHIDIDKFKGSEKREFYKLDQYVDIYHVISKKTSKTLQNLTSKSITYIPFWINQDTFYQINDKTKLREKYGIPIESYSIGSFQRDTEKKGYKRPKLSKGPDQYLEIAKHLNTTVKRLHVVLAGKKREYIISRLKKENINYSYNHKKIVTTKDLKELLVEPSVCLLDARDPDRFSGKIEPIDKKAGHVPGAINVPFKKNLNEDGTFKNIEELRSNFKKAIKKNKTQIINMCGSGVTACHNLLAMEHCGIKNSKIYVGSWSAWSSYEDATISGEKL